MTYPKLFATIALIVFATIALLAYFKNNDTSTSRGFVKLKLEAPLSVELGKEVRPVVSVSNKENVQQTPFIRAGDEQLHAEETPIALVEDVVQQLKPTEIAVAKGKESPPLPEADRIAELFNKGEPKLPFVETIVYKSRVPWHKDRPAWLSDYANYYATSRHFIARSLNGKPDYLRQEVANGDRFNVFRKDKNIHFHLLVDIGRLKMWFYAVDVDTQEKTLLKTYRVGLGRPDGTKASGTLTPVGTYRLGNKTAVYQPKVEGHHKGDKVEMIRIFGARWIPFEKEMSGCSEPAKGYGLHGVPWLPGGDGALREDISCLGEYKSDGCIRLADSDIKEVYAIITTRPTTIELVKDFYDSEFPSMGTQHSQ